MGKILTRNGKRYSRVEFDGYTHRMKAEFQVEGKHYHDNLDIYTDDSEVTSVAEVIESTTKDGVEFLGIVNKSTKEQDERIAKLLEETLKDL